MARNAMLCFLILSIVLALAFATNKKDEKEAENHSTSNFGKVGRFVTVALAMSSRLGGAGASRESGAVQGREASVDNLKFNRLQNNNWMAPPPPMPMNGAEVDGSKLSPAEYLKKFAQDFRRKTGISPAGPDTRHHQDTTLEQEKREVPGGPNPKHNHDAPPLEYSELAK
uniref:CLAVATA3/ESR-like protein n=1 Tax=Globodera pallida TaxID=36090 RepID=A0A0K0KDU0_GLOPA|nr:CLAVATA3/ESR-like protein [Globodera pallida]